MSSRPDSPINRELMGQFAQCFGHVDGICIARAPGRVNLLGDHTDYNDGFVLPMTVDRGVHVALRQRDDERVRLYSTRYAETIEFELADPPDTRPGNWRSYVVGIVEMIGRRCRIGGMDGVIHGDLSAGAGLSSSAALEVSLALALQKLFGFEFGAVDMIRLCQDVEHRYAEVHCGIMDQFASRLGRAGHALFLDCRSLDYRDIALTLDDVCVVVINSNVKRSLAGSGYNERRRECRAAVEFFRRSDRSVRALRDVSADELSRSAGTLEPSLLKRSAHVVSENQRVVEAADLLEAGRLSDMGRLMNESHASLRDDFEASCREVDALVDIAQQTAGVLGARMTGGGFGGCTVNLVRRDAVTALEQKIRRDYERRFGRRADMLVIDRNMEAG